MFRNGLVQEDEVVYFEIRNILMKVKEYKRTNSLMMSADLIQIYSIVGSYDLNYDQKTIISLIIDLEEKDEFILIAFVNFYAKLISCTFECANWIDEQLLLKMLDQVAQQEPHYQLVYFEKRLKLIRNIFELPVQFLTTEVIGRMWNLLKSTEMHSNLLVKELTRDVLSQSVKRLCFFHWNELGSEGIQRLFKELVREVDSLWHCFFNEPARQSEICRLIEYPLQILQFIVRQYTKNGGGKHLKDLIFKDVLYLMMKLSQTVHQVILTILLDMTKYIIEGAVTGLFDDVIETRALLGQVVLNSLQKLIKRLINQQEQIFSTDADVLTIVNFLKSLFSNRPVINHLYARCDINPVLTPILDQILEAVFELSRVSRRMCSDNARFVQNSIQELLVVIFKCSHLTDPKLKGKAPHYQLQYNNLAKLFDELISQFNNEPRKAFALLPEHILQEDLVCFLKTCNRIDEKSMIEILGYHKEKCVAVMENYVESFNFKGLMPVDALRLILSNFLMFGESQMIERVLNKFTLVYFEQNGNEVFQDSDSLFTFTYALILLNTDLHSPTVHKRMSLDDFIRQCSKINAGQNLPEQFVKDSYVSISNDGFKCTRDYETSQFLTNFVWGQLIQNKQIWKKESEQCIQLFLNQVNLNYNEVVNDSLLQVKLSELLFHKTAINIEHMVQQYGQDGIEDFVHFLQEVLKVCIDSDKMESAQMILDQLYACVFDRKSDQVTVSKQSIRVPTVQYCIDTSLHVHLYTCFLIGHQIIQYLNFSENENTNTLVKLIRYTVKFRMELGTEIVAKACSKIVHRIRQNSKFSSRNLGSNSGIFSLFQKFLQYEEHDEDESEDDSIQAKEINQQIQQVNIRDPNILIILLDQTKYLTEDNLIGFVIQLLKEIKNLKNLDEEYLILTQIIYIVTEIIRINGTRLHNCWRQLIPILCLTVDRGQFILMRKRSPIVEHLLGMKILKRSRQRIIDGFFKYQLLKLIIQFAHLCEELDDYEWCYNYSLQYLEDQSLEILVEFLTEVATYSSTSYLEEAPNKTMDHTVNIIIRIYEILQKRSLDPVDADVIFKITQECIESLSLKQKQNVATYTFKLLGVIILQPNIEILCGAFVVRLFTRLLSEMEVTRASISNEILDYVLQLISRPALISKTNFSQLQTVTLLQKITLFYDLTKLTYKDLKQLFIKISSFQNWMISSKNEEVLQAYAQVKSRVQYFLVSEKESPLLNESPQLKDLKTNNQTKKEQKSDPNAEEKGQQQEQNQIKNKNEQQQENLQKQQNKTQQPQEKEQSPILIKSMSSSPKLEPQQQNTSRQ